MTTLTDISWFVNVVDVSWQDQRDDRHPTAFIEEMTNPFVGLLVGLLVVLREVDEPGHPLLALGRVASIDRDKGLLRFDRLTDVIVAP